MNENQKVFYNTVIPSVNHLGNWKLNSYYKLTFVLFSIFLSLVVYAHLKVDRDKWIGRYKKALSP